jgi:hypothetical protein
MSPLSFAQVKVLAIYFNYKCDSRRLSALEAKPWE